MTSLNKEELPGGVAIAARNLHTAHPANGRQHHDILLRHHHRHVQNSISALNSFY